MLLRVQQQLVHQAEPVVGNPAPCLYTLLVCSPVHMLG